MSFCFVHIEKAAGITLHEIFKNNFLFYGVFRPWYFKSNDFYLTAHNFQKIRLFVPVSKHGFGGHTVREFEGYKIKNKKINYITFLRNPTERYISHFFHQKDKMGITRTFKEYTEIKYFNNYMVNRISKKGSLIEAIEKINTFQFVGLIEKFEYSLVFLNELLFDGNLDIRFEIKNIGQSNNNYDTIMKSYGDVINRNNQLDEKLYDHVKNIIFPKYFEKIDAIKLDEEINNLRMNNIDFKFNTMRSMFQKVYFYFYLYPLDYIFSYKEIKKGKKNLSKE